MLKGFSFLYYALSGIACSAAIAGVVLFAREAKDSEQLENIKAGSIEKNDDSFYETGDWTRYILMPDSPVTAASSYEAPAKDSFVSDGSFNTKYLYGKSIFTSKKYRLSADDEPRSMIISEGLVPETDFKFNLQGNSGKRLSVFIDHDSKRTNSDENKYVIKYKAEKDDEILRELNAGDVDIKVAKSKYAIFESNSEKAYGIDLTLKKGNFELKTFGSIAKGNDETEVFKGKASSGSASIAEYQYVRNKYFQIEPFHRYGGSAAISSTHLAFTSAPSTPASYSPYSVTIESGSIEIWCDDQTGIKKNTVFSNPPDGGSYVQLVEGTDFSVNYSTGEINFSKTLSDQSRVFVGYRLSGGLTSNDPSVVYNTFISGKNFVFIKYGTLKEDLNCNGTIDAGETDINGDSKISYDVYEIRSRYYIGNKKIQTEKFSYSLYKDNRKISASDAEVTGKYNVDYQNGIIAYYLREPFRPILTSEFSNAVATRIYGTSQSRLYEVSHYSQKVEYYSESSSYQLKHSNIVDGSVRVKVNGSVVAPSLYSVNSISGIIEFTSSANPLIGDSTVVEIRYQYTTTGSDSRNFIGGFRGDYRINDSLAVGGTLLYSKTGVDDTVPSPGDEPTRTVVMEGDTSLKISPSKFGRFASALTGKEISDLPVEFTGYAEYAKSYKDINTFGKVMIDDMESVSDTISLSLAEKDWILSSQVTGDTRGLLYYKYYRNPSSPSTLHGETFSSYSIDYSVKPGPYNIAGGHYSYSDKDKNSDRRSLVFDFDNSSANCVSAAVRLDSKETDLSGLQYIEVWYRASAGSGSVNLSFDIGSINEDSDDDGVLDTEDVNHNGYLDIDPGNGVNEDAGYTFNPSSGTATKIGGGPHLNSYTIGDGVLTSEDINNNGILDTTEKIVSFPGTYAYVYNDSNVSSTSLSVSLLDTTWKKARIYLRRDSLNDSDWYALEHARALRLNIRSSGAVGKIWIDTVNLVSAKWRDVRINGTANENSDQFKNVIVDTLNDSDYSAHSFVKEQGSLYESLYGEMTSAELHDAKESAMLLQYNTLSTSGSVTRIFTRSIDLQNYRTLSLWFNSREATSGDIMRVYIGSADNDYITYDFPIDSTGYWKEATMRLASGSTGLYASSGTTGNPDLSMVKFMRVEVRSSGSGKVWINNIYAKDPQKETGSAYWYEGTIKGKRPLYVTAAGTPIMNNIAITWIKRRHDADFSSPGRLDEGLYENVNELKTSFTILPRLEFQSSVVKTRSEANSFDEKFSSDLRGRTDSGKYYVQLDYTSNAPVIPSFSFVYNGENRDNSKENYDTSGTKYSAKTEKVVHSPRISMESRFEDFVKGKWLVNIISDNTFQSWDYKESDTGTSEKESELRQKNSLKTRVNYDIGYLSFAPEITLYNNEIIKSVGVSSSSEITRDFSGGFHLPFIGDPENLRFSERNLVGDFKISSRETKIFAPSMIMRFKYAQNSFADFLQSEVSSHPEFLRTHSAQSVASTDISLPFNFSEPLLKIIKSISINYGRTSALEETYVPYEGETKGLFDEEYGMSRAVSGIAPGAYNMITYFPGYFFAGRGNFARGRDKAESTLNTNAVYSSGDISPYTNDFKLIENCTLQSALVFNGADLALSTGYNFLTERSEVGGVPGEQFTLNAKGELALDLMKIFSFSLKNHDSQIGNDKKIKLTLDYGFSRIMLITNNIREDRYTPGAGISFAWDRSSLVIKATMDYRIRQTCEYISSDESERNSKDDIYYNAMSKYYISEKNIGFVASIKYETEAGIVYDFFSNFYDITTRPRFSFEYEFTKNSYDYKTTISPEPYDRHLVTSVLSLDLHKNVKGGLSGRVAIERWYNRETKGLYRQVLSYEMGCQATVHW